MKRLIAWLMCLAMLFSAGAFAEAAETAETAEPAETEEVLETPIAELDNEQLFNQTLMGFVSSVNLTSQKVTLQAESVQDGAPMDCTVTAGPTEKGVALDVLQGEASLGRLEIGQEKAWLSYQGMVIELPYSEVMKLVQMVSQPSVSTDALAPYMETFMGWARRAAQLVAPMCSVTGSGYWTQVHLSMDARQVINVIVTMADEILADREAVTGILEVLAPSIPAQAGTLDYDTLCEAWSSVRPELVHSNINAGLVMDITVNMGNVTADGMLNVEGKQLVMALNIENSSSALTSISGSLTGSLIGNERVEFSFERKLVSRDYGNSTLTGRLDVFGRYETQSLVLDGTTDRNGFHCTLKSYEDDEMKVVTDISAHVNGSVFEGHLNRTSQDSYGDLDMRVYASSTSLDAALTAEKAQASLKIALDADRNFSYGRLYVTQEGESFTEILAEKNVVTVRTWNQEVVITETYPDAEHMVIHIAGSNNYGEPIPQADITTELKQGQDGELWSCTAVAVPENSTPVATVRLFAAEAAPETSLDSAENKMVLTAEMIMQLVQQMISQAMTAPAETEMITE